MTRGRKAYHNPGIEALIDYVCRKKPHEPVERAISQTVFIYTHGNARGYPLLVLDKTTVPDDDLFMPVVRVLEGVRVCEFVLADDSYRLLERLIWLTDAGYKTTDTFSHRLTQFHVVRGLVLSREFT